ncbi:MAG: hypothetical protein QOD01_1878 [Actinomycetota bacterium]|nr:hypothetical protein [Actinomycetota bacterium]
MIKGSRAVAITSVTQTSAWGWAAMRVKRPDTPGGPANRKGWALAALISSGRRGEHQGDNHPRSQATNDTRVVHGQLEAVGTPVRLRGGRCRPAARFVPRLGGPEPPRLLLAAGQLAKRPWPHRSHSKGPHGRVATNRERPVDEQVVRTLRPRPGGPYRQAHRRHPRSHQGSRLGLPETYPPKGLGRAHRSASSGTRVEWIPLGSLRKCVG